VNGLAHVAGSTGAVNPELLRKKLVPVKRLGSLISHSVDATIYHRYRWRWVSLVYILIKAYSSLAQRKEKYSVFVTI